jgi:ferrous iron transport protein B
MSVSPLVVALVGNPNAGKSTLFNALSGLRQQVGNYPGVTVEMKKGHCTIQNRPVDLLDLPGTYSLAARSPDELVAVDLLLGRRPEEPPPDVIVSVADASNLDRHLYLTTQLMELGKPVVLVVNMIDLAQKHGLKIDFDQLATRTGLLVVPIQANKGIGLDRVRSAILEAANRGRVPTPVPLPEALDRETEQLVKLLPGNIPAFLVRRLLLDVNSATEANFIREQGPTLAKALTEARARLAASGHSVTSVEAKARYGWIRNVISATVAKPTQRPVTWTDRLDRVLTHRLWGTFVFLLVMFAMFQAIFVAAEPLMDQIDDATHWLAGRIEGVMASGPLRALLTDGIVVGVGGVIKFLPQILILFAFIAVLEDCGYMARAAYLMDRVMSRCGLSGKSFIPLLSSVACAVPGIMATRVIENRRDRLATIVVAPLMSCSARLPVYGLLIGAFLTKDRPFWLPGLVLFGMYLIGFIVAPAVALLLRKTLLRGERSHFLMELPAYKRPSARLVLRRVIDSGWAFIRRAGTLILLSMILVWALLYFPDRDAAGRFDERVQALKLQAEEAKAKIEDLNSREEPVPEELAATPTQAEKESQRLLAEWKKQSLLGETGRFLEPIFRPLGWDWKIGMAALASFPAREVIVGTLAIIYETGEDDETAMQESIREEWSQDPIRGKYGVPVALSVMVFFALCCQCASTLAVIRRETRSWSWPIFTFVYMTALAYVGALLTFQLGKLVSDAL